MLGMQAEEILRILWRVLGPAVQPGGKLQFGTSLEETLPFGSRWVLTFTFLSFYLLQSFPSNAKCFIPVEGRSLADGGIVP